jgi:3-deoxy-7-phosphoheptulonate synthase
MQSQPPLSSTHLAPISRLVSPDELARNFPLSTGAARFVQRARGEVQAVLRGDDPRLLAIVGPCSIHDPVAALEYAGRLVALRERLADRMLICMRVYFEKPRTTVGWKGLINDPDLDGSCDVGRGLRLARRLLVELAELGLPAATETLDPVAPRYLADAVSWTAIGARTAESQTHRELASGLGMPVGFKNGTDGGLEIAINAIAAARAPHSYLGIDDSGHVGIVRSAGNAYAHLVLRGGRGRPNYQRPDIEAACARLERTGSCPRVVIDCSHDNSAKDHEMQAKVVSDLASQLETGGAQIAGVMLESHLVAGRQDSSPGRPLRYGQSITDACLDFETTASLLERLASAAVTTARFRVERSW